MNNKKITLEENSKQASQNILESMWLLDALDELTQDDPKLSTIISVTKTKLKTAFDKIESSREIISTANNV
ncbi:MAG: hypothetical protein K6E29_07390 [Cyanobacteria bacterium RUI128]|nr:hypothetical protein [Cyanobacteria bacterium RUI128]